MNDDDSKKSNSQSMVNETGSVFQDRAGGLLTSPQTPNALKTVVPVAGGPVPPRGHRHLGPFQANLEPFTPEERGEGPTIVGERFHFLFDPWLMRPQNAL